MKDQNAIPVTDVTGELTREQALAEARVSVANLLEENEEFLTVAFGTDDHVHVVAGCEDFRVIQAMLALLTMLGQQSLGEAAMANLPPAVAQATAVAAGFSKLNEVIRAEATAVGRALNS